MRKTILAALVASVFVIALTTLLVMRKSTTTSTPKEELTADVPAIMSKTVAVEKPVVRTAAVQSFQVPKPAVPQNLPVEEFAAEEAQVQTLDEVLDAAVQVAQDVVENEERQTDDSDSDSDRRRSDESDSCNERAPNAADCRAIGRAQGWCRSSNCYSDDSAKQQTVSDELALQAHLIERMRGVSPDWANEMTNVMSFNKEFSQTLSTESEVAEGSASFTRSVERFDSVLGAEDSTKDSFSQFSYILNQFNQATARIELNEFARRNIDSELISKAAFPASKVNALLNQEEPSPEIALKSRNEMSRRGGLCASVSARAANCNTASAKREFQDRRGYREVSAHRQTAMKALLNQAQIVQWFSEDTELRGYVLPLAEAVEYNQNLLDDQMTVRDEFVPVMLPAAPSSELDNKVDILIDFFNLCNTQIELSLLQIAE